MHIISFGGREHERVEIRVNSYERSLVGEFYDDNWLNVDVFIMAGAFRGRYSATFLTGDFHELCAELTEMHKTLSGSVVFEPMEEQLKLSFTVDKLGHITLRGEGTDQAGIGNTLEFWLSFEQTDLARSISELGTLIAAFPVRE